MCNLHWVLFIKHVATHAHLNGHYDLPHYSLHDRFAQIFRLDPYVQEESCLVRAGLKYVQASLAIVRNLGGNHGSLKDCRAEG